MTLFDTHLPENPPPKLRRGVSRRGLVSAALSTVLTLSVVGGGAYLVRHPQPIIDRVTVWQFEADAAITAHIEALGLTDRGRYLYLASQPEINSTDDFASVCPSGEENFGILGCYLPASKRIHLFDVTDDRLYGTEEVTAAHELLHAAWDRMGEHERARLTSLLEAEAINMAGDSQFLARMDYYSRQEPGERANELHSIIATEVSAIGTELEEYYATYFTERSLVTALHASANAVLGDIKSQSDALIARLDALRASIEADYSDYTTGYDRLNSDIRAYNAGARRDADRQALVRREAGLKSLYTTIETRSAEFETLKSQLTTLNIESAELQRGLNIGGEVEAEV
ncbi:MAG: hypothetical protein JWP30_76 [Homoserinimonas sp.]|jgi:hypothetical protein|nr:hypothetical protein [Homoserinimonas sp.]